MLFINTIMTGTYRKHRSSLDSLSVVAISHTRNPHTMSRRAPNPSADRAAQNQQALKTLVKLENNKSCADCKKNKRILTLPRISMRAAADLCAKIHDGRVGTSASSSAFGEQHFTAIEVVDCLLLQKLTAVAVPAFIEAWAHISAASSL